MPLHHLFLSLLLLASLTSSALAATPTTTSAPSILAPRADVTAAKAVISPTPIATQNKQPPTSIHPSVAGIVAVAPDPVAESAKSVNPFTGKDLSLDVLSAAAQAERLRSQVIDEKVKQAEQLAKIECFKDPASRHCGGHSAKNTGLNLDGPIPPLRSKSLAHLDNRDGPVTAKPASKRNKAVKNVQPTIMTSLPLLVPPSVTLGPRVLGIVHKNGSPAVLVEQGGEVITVASGERIAGRTVGRIHGCSVELSGQVIEVCGRVGNTPLTDSAPSLNPMARNNELLQTIPSASGDSFLTPPPMPQQSGNSSPIIPKAMNTPPLVQQGNR